MRRTWASIAALVAALSTTLVAGPAQAAPNFHGCPTDYLCLWDGWNYTGSVVYISKGMLMEYDNGIRLDGNPINFDNRASSVANHTLMDVRFTRFPLGGCYCWRLDAFHVQDWGTMGWYVNNRASRVEWIH